MLKSSGETKMFDITKGDIKTIKYFGSKIKL